MVIAQVATSGDPISIYGPAGAMVGLVTLVTILGRLHLQAYAREVARTDLALAGWAAQREANEKLADVIEADRAEFRADLEAIKRKLERRA